MANLKDPFSIFNYSLLQRCNRLFQLCEVLAQLVGLFALGC